MKRFLVTSPHTEEDCSKVIKLTEAIGYLTHYYWGCKSGDHCGYAMIEADSRQEALLSVPTLIRQKSTAVEIGQFDPKEVQGW